MCENTYLEEKKNCTVKKDNSSNHYCVPVLCDEILDMAIIEKFDDMM